MERLVIVGTGGHGREVLDVVEAIVAAAGGLELLGFVDDGRPDLDVLARRRVPVLGGLDALEGLGARYVLGIGDGGVRRRLDTELTAAGLAAAAPLVHPTATIGGDVELAPGCVVAAGARITTNVRLGRQAHVNVNATISHDCRLGDAVTVSPGAHVAGAVVLDAEVLVGIGASIVQGCRVGEGTIVGAGAVVVGDLPSGVVATGVPARARRAVA